MAAVTTAVIGGVTAGAGIIQGFQQNKLAKQAAVAAEKSMAEAKKNIGIIESEARTVSTIPVDTMRRRTDVFDAALLERASGDPRSLAAVAGQLSQSKGEREADITRDLSKELQDIEKDVISEKQAASSAIANLNFSEADRQRQEQMAAQAASMEAYQGALGSLASGYSAYSGAKNQEELMDLEDYKAKTDRLEASRLYKK